ncbi:MAG: TIGR03435 family protein [Bryobacteraceae bacterium]
MKLALFLFLSPLVFGQTSKRMSFEVASIRQAAPNQGNGAQTPAATQLDPSQVRLTYLNMQDFIVRAYGVKAYQIVGPDWLRTERYDISATLPQGATIADVPAMLQSLLEERFGLKVHKSQKEFEVFLLGPGKRPFTLKEVEPRSPDSNVTGVIPRPTNGVALALARGAIFTFSDNKLEGKGMSMEMLANQLGAFLGSPALNRTDKQGFYDFTFDLTQEDYSIMMARAAAARGVAYPPELLAQLQSMSNASFLSALEKSGLELKKAKTPLEVINIDEIKKVPTEN